VLRTASLLAISDTVETWNTPGTAEFEKMSYEAIEFDSLALAVARQNQYASSNQTTTSTTGSVVTFGKTQFEALFDIGFDEWEVYDCYVNHYQDYWWDELDIPILQAYQTLGWDQLHWNGLKPPPDSDGKDWYELTQEEQRAAIELCYLPETWSLLSLDFWAVNYASLAVTHEIHDQTMVVEENEDDGFMASNDAPAAQAVDNLGNLKKPSNRFYVWDALPLEILDVLVQLGYTSESWSKVLEAPIEKKTYRDLDLDEFVAVDSLGFGPGDVYDCWINHYHGYDWAHLVAVGGKCNYILSF
jgi:hypothetical protein